MVLRILNVSFHDGPNSPVPPQLVREMKVVLISLIQFLPLSSCLLELWRSLSVKMSIDPKWFVFSQQPGIRLPGLPFGRSWDITGSSVGFGMVHILQEGDKSPSAADLMAEIRSHWSSQKVQSSNRKQGKPATGIPQSPVSKKATVSGQIPPLPLPSPTGSRVHLLSQCSHRPPMGAT